MAKNNYARWQSKTTKAALKTRRIVLLEGARQSGKTTLAKTLSDARTIYRTLDDPALLRGASEDPTGFVRHGDELMIIDEVQRAPDLLLSIKKDVDENQGNGRFLLTGSADIQSLPGVKESLAGRITKVRLRPLSLGEIYSTSPDFIPNAFDGKFILPNPQQTQKGQIYNKDTYLGEAMRGGYPEAIRHEELIETRRWHQDYLTALIDRDLRDIAQIRRKNNLLRLVEILAAWSSKEINLAGIGAALSLSRPTIQTYLGALEALYLIERLRPWHNTDYDRVKKQDRFFMTDSGFMSSILKWSLEAVQFDGDLNGKLIETYVFNQLCAMADAGQEEYQLFHYRDREKREVDFLVQNEAGGILGIEVKSGTVVDKSMFRHLAWFARNIASGQNFTGIVLYSGENVVSYGENMWAVPICAMRPPA